MGRHLIIALNLGITGCFPIEYIAAGGAGAGAIVVFMRAKRIEFLDIGHIILAAFAEIGIDSLRKFHQLIDVGVQRIGFGGTAHENIIIQVRTGAVAGRTVGADFLALGNRLPHLYQHLCQVGISAVKGNHHSVFQCVFMLQQHEVAPAAAAASIFSVIMFAAGKNLDNLTLIGCHNINILWRSNIQ